MFRRYSYTIIRKSINPLNAELNPICHLLALLEAHHILHVSRVRVNLCLLKLQLFFKDNSLVYQLVNK